MTHRNDGWDEPAGADFTTILTNENTYFTMSYYFVVIDRGETRGFPPTEKFPLCEFREIAGGGTR